LEGEGEALSNSISFHLFAPDLSHVPIMHLSRRSRSVRKLEEA
jgi:hypothetical protein